MELEVGKFALIKNLPYGEMPNWSNGMEFMKGKIVEINDVDRSQRTHHFNFSYPGYDSSPYYWDIRHIEEIFDNIEQANAYLERREQIIKEKEEEEKRKIEELKKNMVCDSDRIAEIAKDVFGEERIDIIGSGNSFNIIIHFPEIKILNSRNFSHIIRDLYFKTEININNLTDLYKANIDVYGRRTTLTPAESYSGYAHSHISTGIGEWSRFCLGSSDFKSVIESLKMSLSEEDWYLFFFSIENYVSWESLEGGPYKFMEGISEGTYNLDISHLENELEKWEKQLPYEVFEFNKKLNLITSHPSLSEFYNDKSGIKSMKNHSSSSSRYEEEKVRRRNCTITFKGKVIPMQIIDEKKEIEAPNFVESQVMENYNYLINEKLTAFNKILNYDTAKQLHYEKVFGEARTF